MKSVPQSQTAFVARDPGTWQGFPGMCLTPAGRLVLGVKQAYGHGASRWQRVVTMVSDDRGRTWTAPATLVEGDFDRELPFVATGGLYLTALRDGRVLMHYFTEEWPERKPTTPVIHVSDDAGITWSAHAHDSRPAVPSGRRHPGAARRRSGGLQRPEPAAALGRSGRDVAAVRGPGRAGRLSAAARRIVSGRACRRPPDHPHAREPLRQLPDVRRRFRGWRTHLEPASPHPVHRPLAGRVRPGRRDALAGLPQRRRPRE